MEWLGGIPPPSPPTPPPPPPPTTHQPLQEDCGGGGSCEADVEAEVVGEVEGGDEVGVYVPKVGGYVPKLELCLTQLGLHEIRHVFGSDSEVLISSLHSQVPEYTHTHTAHTVRSTAT